MLKQKTKEKICIFIFFFILGSFFATGMYLIVKQGYDQIEFHKEALERLEIKLTTIKEKCISLCNENNLAWHGVDLNNNLCLCKDSTGLIKSYGLRK